MEIIEKNHNSVSNKNIKKSYTNSDRLFFDTSADLLREGHLVKFRAPGGSMYPTICDGDVITIEPIKPSDVIVGDIILYRHKSGVTAHRVMRILKRSEQSSRSAPQGLRNRSSSETLQFVLRGDAAINNDFPVHADQILGMVVSLERNGRPLDPYCLRIKLLYKTRRLAASIKRFLSSPDSRPS